MTAMSRGHVRGDFDVPTAFSRLWSVAKRIMKWTPDQERPRRPRRAITPRATPRTAPVPQCIAQLRDRDFLLGRRRPNSRAAVLAGTYESGRPVIDCSVFSTIVMIAVPAIPA